MAAVFEISTDELEKAIEQAKHLPLQEDANAAKAEAQQKKAVEKVKSIKYFYAFSAFLLAVFVLFMLLNYNGGENAGPLIVVFLSFVGLIAALAVAVFKPFGKEWEKAKVSKVLEQQSDKQGSGTEY
ncbi:MAG: 2TM domain-containing protein [Alteromonadaceae bacterium]|nr:2TM domain-containing protein [Alteromonadaceae bacterium]